MKWGVLFLWGSSSSSHSPPHPTPPLSISFFCLWLAFAAWDARHFDLLDWSRSGGIEGFLCFGGWFDILGFDLIESSDARVLEVFGFGFFFLMWGWVLMYYALVFICFWGCGFCRFWVLMDFWYGFLNIIDLRFLWFGVLGFDLIGLLTFGFFRSLDSIAFSWCELAFICFGFVGFVDFGFWLLSDLGFRIFGFGSVWDVEFGSFGMLTLSCAGSF